MTDKGRIFNLAGKKIDFLRWKRYYFFSRVGASPAPKKENRQIRKRADRMNQFITLRQNHTDLDKPQAFALAFLDHVLNKGLVGGEGVEHMKKGPKEGGEGENGEGKTQLLKKRMDLIGRLTMASSLEEKDLGDLFDLLGDSPYADRFLLDLLLSFKDDRSLEALGRQLSKRLEKGSPSLKKAYPLLDLCLEKGLEAWTEDALAWLLNEEVQSSDPDYELISLIIEYLQAFMGKEAGLRLFFTKNEKKSAEKRLEAYPPALILQLLDLCGTGPLEERGLDLTIFDSYQAYLEGSWSKEEKPGLNLAQTMFYGEAADTGRGDSGGLAVLLKNLGDALAKDKDVAWVQTLALTSQLDRPFQESLGPGHELLRFPLYLDPKSPHSLVRRQASLKRGLDRYYKGGQAQPDIFHVRYLDNGSKAVAGLSRKLGKKLVFTLTPDPHKSMVDTCGLLRSFSLMERAQRLNKIRIGDELLVLSDTVVGIGDASIRQELVHFFPQIKSPRLKEKLWMISEGVDTDQPLCGQAACSYQEEIDSLGFLPDGFLDKPVLLNVGRLSVAKGQMALMQAWAQSSLGQTHHLLLVGGNKKDPQPQEKEVLDYIEIFLADHPQLRQGFYHQAAVSNDQVRLLEKALMGQQHKRPHIYLASSLKEEFGIAILEAMSQGFLVIGPQKGGVKSYLEDGVNGFLIDTSSPEAMVRDLEVRLDKGEEDLARLRGMQARGKKTVTSRFSIQQIAQDFLFLYQSL